MTDPGMTGAAQVFPLKSLECFYEDEIETLLCGSGERWTVQSLVESIKFDHGYTSTSPVIRHFLEILSELDATDQRRFLRFVTGGAQGQGIVVVGLGIRIGFTVL